MKTYTEPVWINEPGGVRHRRWAREDGSANGRALCGEVGQWPGIGWEEAGGGRACLDCEVRAEELQAAAEREAHRRERAELEAAGQRRLL